MSDVVKAIDDHWHATQTGPRPHLGASQIGEPCERKSVYSFRHAVSVRHEGRMLRLFTRGHLEENRFFGYLRQIGFEVREFAERLTYHRQSDSYAAQPWSEPLDPNCEDVTEFPYHVAAAARGGVKLRQWSFRRYGGHYSGSTDGNARLPASAPRHFPEIPVDTPFLLECKTYNQKSFDKLLACTPETFREFKPLHFVQVQAYMHEMNLPFALYLAVNKNTDALYTLVIPYEPQVAEAALLRAQRIILARQLPPRKYTSPSCFDCKFCDYRGACWYGESLQRHCRTCRHVVPVEDARFQCGLFNALIPLDIEKKGCEGYQVITD